MGSLRWLVYPLTSRIFDPFIHKLADGLVHGVILGVGGGSIHNGDTHKPHTETMVQHLLHIGLHLCGVPSSMHLANPNVEPAPFSTK